MSSAGLGLGSGGGGEGGSGSLLDVSGISDIAGDDNEYDDSELLRRGGGSNGVGAGGRYRLNGNNNNDDRNDIFGGERSSPRRQAQLRPGRTQTAAAAAAAMPPPLPPPPVDTALSSPRKAASLGSARGREDRQAYTPGGSRAPTIDSFLLRNGVGSGGTGDAGGGGSDGDNNGRVSFGLGRDGALVGRAEGVGALGKCDPRTEGELGAAAGCARGPRQTKERGCMVV